MKVAVTSTLILGSALAATAHLGTLTEPKAGQTYQVGSTMTIRWTVTQDHSTQDIAYSKNNGPWVTFATGIQPRAAAQNWTIPADAQGTNIRLRICQRNQSSNVCTDAHNTSQPSGASGGVYTLVSGNFTVAAPTSVRPASTFPGASLAYRPDTRSIEVAFTLAAPEQVTLEAFDTRGKRLAILLGIQKPEGRHAFSVFSHAFPETTPVLLRLQAGDKVLQQTMEAR